MSGEALKNIVNEIQTQYFPEGSIELLDHDELSKEPLSSFLLQYPEGITKMTIEDDRRIMVWSQVTFSLYVRVSMAPGTYNRGILNNVTKRILSEIRNNAIKPAE